jgi:hypothetical protein
MPQPRKGESKKNFISRCISTVVKEGKEQKQAVAICTSIWRGGMKKERYSYKSITKMEDKEDEFVVGGYIATTHFDGEDVITRDTLLRWADEINSENPRANKVSVHHDRVPHVAGVGIPDTAEVHQFPDGEYGLYVDTMIDKTREDFEDIQYRLDNGFLDSFSIEYIAPETVQYNDDGARILDENTVLHGWTLASQPMNEHAVRVKEILKQNKEDNKMAKEEKPETKEPEVKEEVKEKPKPKVSEEKEFKLSAKDYAFFEKAREEQRRIEEESKYNSIKEELMKEISVKLDKEVPEEKVMKQEDKQENPLLKEYKEMVLEGKGSIHTQQKVAAKFATEIGLFNGDVAKPTTRSKQPGDVKFDVKHDAGKYILEYKGLGISTNQESDTDYLLSTAELSDVFDPLIFSMLNQATVTWNILPKEDFSMKGNNQVQFVGKTAANTTAAAYTGNAINLGNVTRQKFQTKFKKYAVGVEVDGDMIAAARGGPIGDVFAKEVADSTVDLLSVMNQDLFAEVGAETASGVIGFEYITDSAGNTTLYNLTRGTGNLLSPAAAGDTYINGGSADITLANLRAAKRQALKEGASIENLVFVCDHIQGDKFRALYDNIQRVVPTSSRFGFEGRPAFDGIPIFEDKDCNDDDWWLVDLESHRIAIWVPPTLEMLGKDADSQKGFIKTYWCTYNRAPRRMVMIYGNATS